jgi:DNA excision repair protein ERCC-4
MITILTDSREQQPYPFMGFGVLAQPATLPTGDYSLPGFEDRAAIERKTLDDLIGCLVGLNRARFERELARASKFKMFAVVVEASLEDVSKRRYRSEMKPEAALQSIIIFQVRYHVPFMWCGTRTGAQYVTHGLLAKYLREVGERYKLAVKAA